MAQVHRTHARMRERGDLPFADRWPASLQVTPLSHGGIHAATLALAGGAG